MRPAAIGAGWRPRLGGSCLCEGIVIDLSGMNAVTVDAANCTARIAGGARAADAAAAADPLGLAAVTGSVGAVGMTGLTLERRLWAAGAVFAAAPWLTIGG